MIWNRIRYWMKQGEREAALREEMAQHIEETAEELRVGGMGAEEAMREARRRFGNLGTTQETVREVWILRYWAELWQDLRYAMRTMWAQPGFTIPAVLALVLGIGVNAVVFNVFNALALAPWAIRDPQEVVQILGQRGTNRWGGMAWTQFRYLRENSKALRGVAGFTGTERVQVTQADTLWTADGSMVSENYFDLIGTGFAAGRGFLPLAADGRPAPEVVLNYETWMSRFGGDQAVLGSWLEISGQKMQIVGVAAQGFNGPVADMVRLWIPAGWRDVLHPGWDSLTNPDFCCYSVVARLAPGIATEQAQAELQTLAASYAASIRQEPTRLLATSPSFLANPQRFKQASAVFLAMGVASLLILLLACSNVANLLLARSSARAQEIAVRLSLGAGHGRILRQLTIESLLNSGVAAALSAGVSTWLPAWTVRMIAPPEAQLTIRFDNDWRVIGFIAGLSCAATLLFGLAPALHSVREGVAMGLRNGMRSTSSSRMRPVLLGAQVTLCAVLLSGSFLLARALYAVQNMDTGFRYDGVVTMSTGLDASGVNAEQAKILLAELAERIRALPGVETVAWAATIPLGNANNAAGVVDPRTKGRISVAHNAVSANFFEVLDIPVVAGRAFSKADEAGSNAVIVSQATAERLWPGESALGKTLDLGKIHEVVGVVRNFETREFGSKQNLAMWAPSAGGLQERLLIRHRGEASGLLQKLPRVARGLDKRIVVAAAPYSESVSNAKRTAKIASSVASVLGGLSLLLAALGIYGVAAFQVAQRRREVGVRMALGATPMTILTTVLQQNLRAVLWGTGVGVIAALGFGRLLTSLLYGIEPSDPLALLATITILVGVAVMATLGPARRAAQVDPAITLRDA